ncbi:hypothetical protein [Nocardioides convexus]|nr:hypothetical protein [Nocardioides convexus]
MTKIRVLVVDDSALVRRLVTTALSGACRHRGGRRGPGRPGGRADGR